MRSLLAVARRVLQQFLHDKRTLGIMLAAPCIVLWLFSVLLGAPGYPSRLVAVDIPRSYLTSLQDERCSVVQTDAEEAQTLLETGQADAVLSMGADQTLKIEVEGADASKTAATISTVRSALVEMQRSGKAELLSQMESLRSKVASLDFDLDQSALDRLPADIQTSIETAQSLKTSIPDVDAAMPIADTQVSYLHGNDGWTAFEFYGPVFIGMFIFVFVFLTSSMSLLTERSGGTIARLIATPIRSWQIVGGYVLGFGLLTLVQSALILWFCIGVVGFPNSGSLLLVAGITVSMALASLTMGLLVSGLAHTPFQVIQLMLVFVVPQILLSGIFDLSQTPTWVQVLASAFPVSYGADALRDVMLRGAGLYQVAWNLGALWMFIVAFFALSCLNFRKKRGKPVAAGTLRQRMVSLRP